MQTVELAEAQSRLPELVSALSPGEEIIIQKDHEPVARLLSAQARQPRPLREFAGKFRPLPQAELENEKPHDTWAAPA